MAQQNAKPFVFHAVGCTDTLDSTEVFPGAMSKLANLIPDPTTKNLWVCRPAMVKLGTVTAVGTPTQISVAMIVGDFVYGMVNQTSGGNNGLDIPFCFNLKTNAVVTVTGTQNNTTLPTSLAAAGDYIPPGIDVCGTFVVIAHQGFVGSANKIGWFDISTPGAPVWHAGDLATNALPSVPIDVKTFFGRAYYACNPAGTLPSVVASDIIAATTRTNANQALSFGDAAPLTGLGTLQFENQLGGVVQALIVFKGTQNLYQVTGDFASTSNPIAQNAMNVATGTLSTNAITNTPKGMIFFAPDGMREMDQNAEISDPIGIDGQGVSVPFISAVVPSRVTASSNGKMIRVSTQNGNAVGQPRQEWWYDMTRQAWCGPHTSSNIWCAPYRSTFIAVPDFDQISLYQSDIYQNSGSSYVENGNALMWTYEPALLPDLGEDMSAYEMHDSYIYLSLAGVNGMAVAVAQDEFGQAIDTTMLLNTRASSFWGSFTWGNANWGGLPNALSPVPINWNKPLQFSRLQLSISGTASSGVEIGALWARIEHLGYSKNNLGGG